MLFVSISFMSTDLQADQFSFFLFMFLQKTTSQNIVSTFLRCKQNPEPLTE